MKIAIASGKGGVGKSMVSSAFAMLFSEEKRIVALDCDVDAPDLGLWLGVEEVTSAEKIATAESAFIDYEKCINCGKCAEICRFNAIEFDKRPKVLRYLCEGCGACEFICPVDAIEIKEVENGEIRLGWTSYGFPLVAGFLYPGEVGSGKIVEAIKKRSNEFDPEVIILDSAAGTGCPVIASLNGADYVVLVTEPTPSGFSDLKNIMEVVNHFRLPFGIIINKWDINPKLSDEIEEWASGKLLGKLPFDKKVFTAISNLKPILETDSVVAEELRKSFSALKDIMGH